MPNLSSICSSGCVIFPWFEYCIEPLERLDYGYLGELGIPGRHDFRKPNTDSWIERTHQIHMVERGNAEWQRMLIFRDYLRDHLLVAQQYSRLKCSLADEFGSHPDAHRLYPEGKTTFVQFVLQQAACEGYGPV